MTAAVWVDDLGVGEEPVPYVVTAAGAVLAGRHRTLEDVEAAALVGVSRLTVRSWALAEVVPAVLVDDVWLFDVGDVLAYDAARRARPGRREQRVPAEPLLRQVDLAGGDYALGVRIGSAEKRALERARHDGTLTLWAADQLAVRLLGMTPVELWGDDLPAA